MRARRDKTFFMLNSVEHEILNAHKYENIKKFSFLQTNRMLFFLLIDVKMPTIVGILTFMSRKTFMLNLVEHEKSLITSEPDCREPWFISMSSTLRGSMLLLEYKVHYVTMVFYITFQ